MWKNLNGKCDWGHAKDYVRGMWLMLQQEEPEDFVLATGETTTVRAFCEMASKCLDIEIEWKDKGVNETGINKKTDETIIEIDPQYFRPTEVEILLGDSSKAKNKLKWQHEYSINDLVEEMISHDVEMISLNNY
jgi:GDPmannose 4,6-dehydratase